MNCPSCNLENDNNTVTRCKDGGTIICSHCDEPFHLNNNTYVCGYYVQPKNILDPKKLCPECNQHGTIVDDHYIRCNECDIVFF